MSPVTKDVDTARYITFDSLPDDAVYADGTPALNKHSAIITRGHDFPGARSMLYAAGLKDEHSMRSKPQVGISSVWWEGNPCNMHLMDLANTVKEAVVKQDMIGWQFNTVGVSDAITMGSDGMRFSLQTREIIADSIESVTCAQYHDGNISIPGCDKNMPGVVMAMARHNRPSLMIYGGTIKPGYSKLLRRRINVTTCYEIQGAYNYNTLIAADGSNATKDEIMTEVENNACPGAGACGGMYTANTMATAIEAMGLTLPGSSSTPAESPAKRRECMKAAEVIKNALAKNIRPRDLITKESFENALVMTMIMGGSTNGVLHFLAMAGSAGVSLTLDDIQSVSDRIPVLADMAPSGKYVMADLYDIGGIPSVMKLLIAAGLLNGKLPTITGKTLGENVESFPSLPQDQTIIRPLSNPVKSTGHIQILRGNLAPGGAVAKISGHEGERFVGKARVFNKEFELNDALTAGEIKHGENLVLIVRYEGPKGGPGMVSTTNLSRARLS
jgi:dihydroxy-acid dehydratase